MTNKKRKLVVTAFTLLILFVVVSFVAPKLALAQESTSGLSVSPPTFEFTANPGNTIESTIRVENVSDTDLKIGVDRRNFSAVGEEGSVTLSEDNTNYTLASWITVTPEEVTIPPKQSHEFSFEINVPMNAAPGGHFSSIVFRTVSDSVDEAGATIIQEVGSLILLRVSGDIEESFEIESFTTDASLYEYGPVEFETRIFNDGNVHVKPKGTITIRNIFGKEVERLDLEQRNVLPKAIRKTTTTWDRRNLFGKYTATLAVSTASNNIETTTTVFYGLPYVIVSIVLVVLIVITILFIKGRKRLALAFNVLFGKDKK